MSPIQNGEGPLGERHAGEGFRWGSVQRKSLSSLWCHIKTKLWIYEWYLPFIALMIHSPLKQPGSHGMVAGLCGPLGLCQCFTSWRLGAAVGTLWWDLGIITAAGFDACGAGTRTHMATATKRHVCRWARFEVARNGMMQGAIGVWSMWMSVCLFGWTRLWSFIHLANEFFFWGWILGSQPWSSMRPVVVVVLLGAGNSNIS